MIFVWYFWDSELGGQKHQQIRVSVLISTLNFSHAWTKQHCPPSFESIFSSTSSLRIFHNYMCEITQISKSVRVDQGGKGSTEIDVSTISEGSTRGKTCWNAYLEYVQLHSVTCAGYSMCLPIVWRTAHIMMLFVFCRLHLFHSGRRGAVLESTGKVKVAGML